MRTIEEHLEAYGLRLHRSREAFISSCRADIPDSQWWEAKNSLTGADYYDHIVGSGVANILQSGETGAIVAIGNFAQNELEGRQRILDLGCGTGYLTTFLASCDKTSHVMGVDFSQESIAYARRIASHLGISNVEFSAIDIRQDLPRGPFDAILDSWTLVDDSIFDRRQRHAVFRHCGRVLAKNGTLISVLHDDRDSSDIARFVDSMLGSGVSTKRITSISGAPFQTSLIEHYPTILAESNPETEEVLWSRILNRDDGNLALNAALAIEHMGLNTESIPYLAIALASRDITTEIRGTLERSLSTLSQADQDMIPALTSAADRNARVGLVIAKALSDIDPRTSVQILTNMIRRSSIGNHHSFKASRSASLENIDAVADADTLRTVIELLAMSGLTSKYGRLALYAAIRDSNKSVRLAARRAIKRISTLLWLTLPIRRIFTRK